MPCAPPCDAGAIHVGAIQALGIPTQIAPTEYPMNLGFGELLIVFGIITLLVLGASMIAGAGLVISRRLEPKPNSLLQELRLRYERGEISRKQYEAMKKELA